MKKIVMLIAVCLSVVGSRAQEFIPSSAHSGSSDTIDLFAGQECTQYSSGPDGFLVVFTPTNNVSFSVSMAGSYHWDGSTWVPTTTHLMVVDWAAGGILWPVAESDDSGTWSWLDVELQAGVEYWIDVRPSVWTQVGAPLQFGWICW